ncbi:Zn-dependent hydrolase [Oceanobacillus sojae]|uniref:Zn-dependent hydrolase n=1 Tax=Oceanobacillus sojae TaxID=582851 RepID=UPI0021A28488|nr:Zn-dependent hydrolase [Oceanobacillus sojae]MCT1901626.1 Zn-dependent hydrolase [Oceanobacillus sojae]
MDFKRLEQTLKNINSFSEAGEGINRLAYTDEERQAADEIGEICKKEGMSVKYDSVGNLIARREGTHPELPAVAFGSHIDSVYEAGAYDGTLGVAAAIEIIRSLNEAKIQTEHPLELIVFACEESARFSFSTLGSKAIAGLLKKEDIADLQDKDGIFLRDAFQKYKLHLDKFGEVKQRKGAYKAFFELHVEQGPVLEEKNIPIGIVTGIAGATRFQLNIEGEASHSGTTPMGYRKDAFLGAAEIALAIEKAAKAEKSVGTVATVGVCDVEPGAMNVIPGRVKMQVDIRGISEASKKMVIQKLFQSIKDTEEKRGLIIHHTRTNDQAPVVLSEEVIQELSKTCDENEYAYQLMPSGAGHDAMNMTNLCPVGLIFIPSEKGLSHNPKEYSSIEQIAPGATILKQEILKWAGVADRTADKIQSLP